MRIFVVLSAVYLFSQNILCTKTIEYEVSFENTSEKYTYLVLKATGTTEDNARQELQLKLPELERKALEDCKNKFENQSLCISQKLNAVDYLTKTDLQARKMIEQMIIDECKKNIGRCKLSQENEIKCTMTDNQNQEEKNEK